VPLPRPCVAEDPTTVSNGGEACDGSVEDGSPVPLCRRHRLLALEFATADTASMGLEDVLASPCVLCGSRLGVRYPTGVLCAVCEWRVGDIPETDIAPPRLDVVYYIRFRDRIKIGTSSNPRGRLAALWHDELLAFERGDRHVERRRHEQFAAHRLGRSEWFASHDALADHIDTLRAGIDDPWRLHLRWVSEAVAAQA
jgi:hypothetical protein